MPSMRFFGFARNGKDYVLLAQAALADGAGVFAAVAGVEDDDGLAVVAAVGCARRRGTLGAGRVGQAAYGRGVGSGASVTDFACE